MTCGICSPEAFRPNTGARVLGYLCTDDPAAISVGMRRLHWLGAEVVLLDKPIGKVRDRRALSLLMETLRPGDRLLLKDLRALGSGSKTILRELESSGVEVCTVRITDHTPGYKSCVLTRVEA